MHEVLIVWLGNPSDYPYLRETKIYTHTRTTKMGRSCVPGRLVAYATLSKDTPSDLHGEFLRRVWYVAPHDPYPGGSIEAKEPSTVRKNKESA